MSRILAAWVALALVAGPPPAGGEAAIRARAAALHRLGAEADPDPIWAEAAGDEGRDVLLRAAARAWAGRPGLAALARHGLEAGLEAAAGVAAAAAPADSELDAALAGRLASAPIPPPELLTACWRRGVVPAEGAAADLRGAWIEAANRALARGMLPTRHLAAALAGLDDPTRLLLALAGRSLPAAEAAGLRAKAGTLPDPDTDLLLRLVLLDQGADPAPGEALDRIWGRIAGLDRPEAELGPVPRALLDGLRRHALELPASVPGPVPPPAGVARDFLLRDAPIGKVRSFLAAVARDPGRPPAERRLAVLRLARGLVGEALPILRPLLDSPQPDEVLEAVLSALEPVAGPELAAALAERSGGLPTGRSLRPALTLLLRHGPPERRRHLLPRVLDLPVPARFRTALAAWEAGADPGILAVYQAWTRTPDRDVQKLAVQLLAKALSEEEAAAFYRRRLKEERNPAVREQLVASIRWLRTDAALAVFLEWLDSPEGRNHPQAADWAFLVVPEEAARPMFRRWWQERDRLPAGLVDAAASALAPTDPEARAFLWSRLPALSVPAQVALIDRLRQGAGADDLRRWRDGFLDPTLPAPVRRAHVLALARESALGRPTMEEFLDLLVGRARLGSLPEGPWPDFVAALVAFDPPARRAGDLALLREAEAALADRAAPLRAARLRGQAQNPDPGEAEGLAEEVLALLEAEPIGAPIADPALAADPNRIRNRRPLLHLALLAAGRCGEPADRRLAELLTTAPAERAAGWPGESLRLLAAGHRQALPSAAEAAEAWLRALEPADSPYRPPDSPAPLPLRFQADREAVLRELQARLPRLGPDGDREFESGLKAARERWPEDRRVHDLAGWAALARGDLEAARRAFAASRLRSGPLPETQREPRLGLAVAEELAGRVGAVAAFLAEDPGAGPLLPHRLAVAANPALAPLLESAATAGEE
ncbi:MAG: hypothetical protein D6702_07970 [Planctomycetota bacterium]|nr:MAG: hypothetical protein D6702_07970 [Planctomycetota bacterium]